MAYTVTSKKSGKTYHLHQRRQKLKGGQEVTIYYFAGVAGPEAIELIPDGYEVWENSKTGLPFLKKKG
jgi:hypothetical protein